MKHLKAIIAAAAIACGTVGTAVAGDADAILMRDVQGDNLTALHGIYTTDSGFFVNGMLFPGRLNDVSSTSTSCSTKSVPVVESHHREPSPPPVVEPPSPPPTLSVPVTTCSDVQTLSHDDVKFFVGGGYRVRFDKAWLFGGIGKYDRTSSIDEHPSALQWGVVSPFDKRFTVAGWMIVSSGHAETFAGVGYHW